jgi:hypothetical protein
MPCLEASELQKRISFAKTELRNVRNPESKGLSEADKSALEKRARQDLRLASRALREHHFVCEICDKED